MSLPSGFHRRNPSALSSRGLLIASAVLTLALVGCYPNPDGPAPTITGISPAAGSTSASVNAHPTATFDSAMAALSPQTFTLKQGSSAVAGTVSMNADNTVATFAPNAALAAATAYTATITTGATNAEGTALAAAKSWSFTTSSDVQANSRPEVTDTSPEQDATGIALNAKITATFTKAMDPLSFSATSVTVRAGTTNVPGSVALGLGNIVTFTPTAALPASTLVTATLSTDVRDTNGNQLGAAYTFSFTTGASADTTAPQVSVTHPDLSAANVATNTTVAASFSEPMDPFTISAATFTVTNGTTPVTGNVAYAGSTVTFTPGAPLPSSTTFTATVTTGAKDLAGNALAAPFTWTFSTGSSAALGPAVVQLGTAKNFVILAKTAISTVPPSALTGNIGVSPAAGSFLTGFSETKDSTNVFSTSTQITGKAYAADYAVPTPSNLTTAVSNMQTAYTDAAGRVNPDHLDFHTGNLGGLTLTAGLYKFTTNITMPNDLTITGGANDVFIFQTTGDLLMSANKGITLSGGVQAKNIFWQVAGQVSIESGAHFEGIILCKTQVTLVTGATMNGRILAQTQVALQSATVVQPAN